MLFSVRLLGNYMSLADHIKAFKGEGWELKLAVSVFMVKLHGFLLNYIIYICTIPTFTVYQLFDIASYSNRLYKKNSQA